MQKRSQRRNDGDGRGHQNLRLCDHSLAVCTLTADPTPRDPAVLPWLSGTQRAQHPEVPTTWAVTASQEGKQHTNFHPSLPKWAPPGATLDYSERSTAEFGTERKPFKDLLSTACAFRGPHVQLPCWTTQ